MRKHFGLLIAASLVSGHVFALPGASFFGKLFRGGTEATAAGHAAEKAAATKGAEHLSAIEPPRGIHTVPTLEPKANFSAEPMGLNKKDLEAYRAYREKAEKGDALAYLKMSEMTSTGRVSDPGEPWRGYWLFQSARLGSQAANKRFREECGTSSTRRTSEPLFDSACASIDGRKVQSGGPLMPPVPPYRN
jgi:hypothetical protein